MCNLPSISYARIIQKIELTHNSSITKSLIRYKDQLQSSNTANILFIINFFYNIFKTYSIYIYIFIYRNKDNFSKRSMKPLGLLSEEVFEDMDLEKRHHLIKILGREELDNYTMPLLTKISEYFSDTTLLQNILSQNPQLFFSIAIDWPSEYNIYIYIYRFLG